MKRTAATGGMRILTAILLIMGASGSLADQAQSDLEHGRYLVRIGGCNDCHTPGYLMTAGQVPEKLWLTGDSFGWRGPWGTTYAPNLRNLMQKYSESEWIDLARKLKTRPPMPWFTLNEMHEDDLKAIYRYIRYLGPAGKEAPAYVPPDQEPKPPFALFPPPPPAG